MALQVWLPLNESTTNLGISEYKVTENGRIRYSASNLGKKAFHSGEGSVAVQLSPTTPTLSIALWFKPLGANKDNVLLQFGDTKIVCDGNSNYKADGNGILMSKDILFRIEKPSWNHLAIVADGENVKVYLNGELANTERQAKTIVDSFASIKTISIGADANAFSGWLGLIDDLKIYDNALSQRYVKDLAKGMIIHYTFNHYGFGNHNLMNGSENDISLSTSATYYAIENDKYYVDLKANGVYTLSAVTTGSWTSVNSTAGHDASERATGLELYRKDGDTITSREFYDLSEKGYVTITPTADSRYYLGFIIYSDGNTTINVTISQIKLEVGETATTYVPPKNSDRYEALGIDDFEADTSGNMLDGIIDSEEKPLWTNDSPMYSGSFELSNGSYIESASIDTSEISGNYTISIWINGAKGKPVVTESFELPAPAEALDSKWHLLTLTPSAVYVDGKKNSTSSKLLSGTKFYFGINSDKNLDTWDGRLSDFRLYGTILSDDDIMNLYKRRFEIDNLGQIYAGEFVNKNVDNILLHKTGVINELDIYNAYGTNGVLETEVNKFAIKNKNRIDTTDAIEL